MNVAAQLLIWLGRTTTKKSTIAPMNIKYLFILLLFPMNSSIFAQNIDEDKIIMRAVEKVAQLNDYISFMADKSRPLNYRLMRKEKALNLFIGKGYGYVENGVDKEGVMMEFSTRNKRISHTLLRHSFDNLCRIPGNDTGFQITAVEIIGIKVSELLKIDDNLWECTCEYDQAFEGIRDGQPIFRKINTKKVKCFVKTIETEDGIIEHIIQLGDVYALETRY